MSELKLTSSCAVYLIKDNFKICSNCYFDNVLESRSCIQCGNLFIREANNDESLKMRIKLEEFEKKQSEEKL
jgi:ribosomal protein L40E